MEKAYSQIVTLQYKEDRTSETSPKYSRSFHIDKPQQKMKISATGVTLELETFTQIWTGNDYYNIKDYSGDEFDTITKATCPGPAFTLGYREEIFEELISTIRKFSPVEVVGKETINGREALKISLGGKQCIRFSGSPQEINLLDKGSQTGTCEEYIEGQHFLWLDAQNYLPLKESNPPAFEVVYTDYKINEDIPSNIFTPPQGEITEVSCSEDEEVDK